MLPVVRIQVGTRPDQKGKQGGRVTMRWTGQVTLRVPQHLGKGPTTTVAVLLTVRAKWWHRSCCSGLSIRAQKDRTRSIDKALELRVRVSILRINFGISGGLSHYKGQLPKIGHGYYYSRLGGECPFRRPNAWQEPSHSFSPRSITQGNSPHNHGGHKNQQKSDSASNRPSVFLPGRK